MTWELAWDIILDALKDSALVFAFVFVIHVIISFFEHQLANFLIKERKPEHYLVLYLDLFLNVAQVS